MSQALAIIGLFHLILWIGLALLTFLEPPRRSAAPSAVTEPISLEERRRPTTVADPGLRRSA